jgi:hypothetical protein
MGFSIFVTASIPALGPTQLPIQWVQEVLILGIKQLEHEADHLCVVPRLRRCAAIPPLPNMSSGNGA